ncbi:MAG: hypothetical protein WAR79_01630 [Melioribacteraceae bacterium]
MISTYLFAQESNTELYSERYDIFKNFQIKMGYSYNKDITNFELNYSFPLSHAFAFGIDVRLLSFPTISPSIVTMPIILTEKISISIKGGIEFFVFSPIPLANISTQFGGLIRYKIKNDYNLFLEFKQINQNTSMDGFTTFLPRKHVSGFPFRFVSFGIEF